MKSFEKNLKLEQKYNDEEYVTNSIYKSKSIKKCIDYSSRVKVEFLKFFIV